MSLNSIKFNRLLQYNTIINRTNRITNINTIYRSIANQSIPTSNPNNNNNPIIKIRIPNPTPAQARINPDNLPNHILTATDTTNNPRSSSERLFNYLSGGIFFSALLYMVYKFSVDESVYSKLEREQQERIIQQQSAAAAAAVINSNQSQSKSINK